MGLWSIRSEDWITYIVWPGKVILRRWLLSEDVKWGRLCSEVWEEHCTQKTSLLKNNEKAKLWKSKRFMVARNWEREGGTGRAQRILRAVKIFCMLLSSWKDWQLESAQRQLERSQRCRLKIRRVNVLLKPREEHISGRTGQHLIGCCNMTVMNLETMVFLNGAGGRSQILVW